MIDKARVPGTILREANEFGSSFFGRCLMKTTRLINGLIIVAALLAMPAIASAQRTKPRLRRPAPRYTPIVAVGSNLRVRLNETLSSKDSRAGDRFTATVVDPARLSEATVNGHVRSILKSGKIQGRTTMNLAFDSINLTD